MQVSPSVYRPLLALGILLQQGVPTDMDGVIFQSVGDRIAAVPLDADDDVRLVDAEAIRQIEIDFLALCRQLRTANRFEGAPVERLTPKVFWLGALGRGSRRHDFYVVRSLRARNAIEIGLSISGRSLGVSATILTPTERNLPQDILRRLAAEQISFLAIDAILFEGASAPLTISLPLKAAGTVRPKSAARLTVDAAGHRAVFDGVDVVLQKREFNVLLMLAIELTDKNGVVPREYISEAIRQVTGNEETNEEQVDKAISTIRRALRQAGGLPADTAKELIKNTRGVGYRLSLLPETVDVS